ncbi:MAG: hypothetical protein ACR2JT_04775 [Nocardioidaceae bacterium]
MNGHPDWCHEVDDPVALALWKSRTPALVDWWCGQQRHRVGKVYRLPEQGLVLVLPGYEARAVDVDLDGTVSDHQSEGHFHAVLYYLDEATGMGSVCSRCQCGTWLIRREQARSIGGKRRKGSPTFRRVAEYTRSPHTVQE